MTSHGFNISMIFQIQIQIKSIVLKNLGSDKILFLFEKNTYSEILRWIYDGYTMCMDTIK